MLENININCHSSIKILGNKIIYIDPFKINSIPHDADYIFITHSHYDHFSTQDILKVAKLDTIFIVTDDIKSSLELLGIPGEQIFSVIPENEYIIKELKFKTFPAYNINKKFHKKDYNWVGYLIELDGLKYYIAGDTDNIPEIQNIECDVAFLPIGGTYTMNVEEAATLANTIKANVVVPIHYGEIVGSKTDCETFAKLVKGNVEFLI